MARKVHGSRALLNQPGHHSTAAIVAEIEDTRDWIVGRGRGGADLQRYNAAPLSTFTITDCDSKVNIEVGFDSDNGLENSLHKVDTMISALRKLRRGLVLEGARYAERAKRIPPDRKFGG